MSEPDVSTFVRVGVLPSVSPANTEPPVPVAPDTITTNAVNRGLSDLHTPTWLALLAVNITGRTLVFHPMQLAIARKRVTRAERPPTVSALVRAAYQGGHQSFPTGNTSKDTYNFGRGGVRGVYRGVGAALISNLVGEVSYLFTLEMLKEQLESLGGGGGNTKSTSSAGSAMTVVDSIHGMEGVAFGYKDDFTAHSTPAAVGAMAGDLVALLLVTPTVVICNRQATAGFGMAAHNAYRSVPATFREVWGAYQNPRTATALTPAPALRSYSVLSAAWWRNGFRGIYQGTSAGLLRIPSSGCWWALYTKSKEWVYRMAAPTLSRLEERRMRSLADGTSAKSFPIGKRNWFLSPTDNPLLNATAGVFASVATTVLFNPMAVIQTRQQALPPAFWARDGTVSAGDSSSGSVLQRMKRGIPFQRVYAVAADLVKTEGPRAFFKGTSANVSVAVMDGVLFSLLFELSKLGSDTHLLEKAGILTESIDG